MATNIVRFSTSGFFTIILSVIFGAIFFIISWWMYNYLGDFVFISSGVMLSLNSTSAL